MKTYKSIPVVILLIFILCSCYQKNGKIIYPVNMVKGEKLLIKNPQEALSLLMRLQQQIKDQPKGVQMYYELLLFRAQDMCYVIHKSKDKVDKCISYYKNEVDDDKLMMSYYCLGCYYRDQEDDIEAVKAFQEALNFAHKSEDYSLIGRIYNQKAYLSNIENERLELYKISAKYFDLAKDSITLLYSYRDVASAYQSLTRSDSALYYGLKAYTIAIQLNDSVGKNVMNNQLAGYYLMKGDYRKGKSFLDRTILNLKDEDDNSLYYSDLGEYYQKVDKLDSAIYYFNKCIQVTKDINLEYDSYIFLHQIYRDTGSIGKALECAERIVEIGDQIKQKAHDDEVTKLNAHYGVKRMENNNSKLKLLNQYKDLWLCGLTCIILLLILSSYFVTKHLRKIERVKQLKLAHRLKQGMSDKNKETVEEKIKQIVELENKLQVGDEERMHLMSQLKELHPVKEQLMKQQEENVMLENRFKELEIYWTFHKAAVDDINITNFQWSVFMDAIDDAFDHFNKRLFLLYPGISDIEIKVCNLVKAGFNPLEMSKQMKYSPSNISSIRRRLYKKITAKNGFAADMDLLLKKF